MNVLILPHRSPSGSSGRIFAGLLACLLAGIPAPATAAVGAGATTAGGGRATAGAYAHLSTLGQIAGPPARGGAYQLTGGLPASLLRTDPPPSDLGTPRLAVIPDQVLNEDSPPWTVQFSLGDTDTPPAQLTVSASTSRPELIAPADLELGGTGTNRVVRLTPRPNQSGVAVITVTVGDPQNHSAQRSFRVEVLPVNDPPVISTIADVAIESGRSRALEFNVNDLDDSVASIRVVAATDRPNLLPPAGLVLTGEGVRRQLVITPASSQAGDASVQLQVTDPHGGVVTTSFRVTVTPGTSPARPRIVRLFAAAGGRFRVRVAAEAGTLLTLESSASLGPNARWQSEGARVTSGGGEVELESEPGTSTSRFFRIRAD